MLLKSLTAIALLAAALSLSACKAPQAFGDRHSVIVHADPALWAQVDSLVMGTLEDRVFTNRPERKFKLTFVAAGDTIWRELRLWQQVLVLGDGEDEVARRLVKASGAAETAPPAILQATDVWARGQLATVLLLPETGQVGAVAAALPELRQLLDERFDEWVLERMYTSGLDDSLKQVLAGFGFTLDLPRVYRDQRDDSVFRFSNPYRQGDSDLLRSVLLSWRSGAAGATPEGLRAWRNEIDELHYAPPQDVLADGVRFATVEVGGRIALEFRGVWQDRADFPAAGPFVTRAVACPEQNRTYYMDAWLFAPGRDKFPYLRQLEILLDSFRCVSGATAGAGGNSAEPAG